MSRPLMDYARRGQPVDGFPLFDVHAHIYPDGEMLPLAEQVAEMDRCGIRLAAVSATVAIGGDLARGNDQVAAAARQFPGRFAGYCHVSANYPETMQSELERCFRDPVFRGIKLYQTGVPFDNPLFDPVWEFARARRVPVLAHTWGGNFTGFDRAAEKHPEVKFLVGHAGSGFVYQPCIDAARRLPNFFLDLTYSREHTGMIEHLVESVGPERIVWGTDAPVFSMAQQLGKLLFARIPDAAKRRILGANQARLFGLVPGEWRPDPAAG